MHTDRWHWQYSGDASCSCSGAQTLRLGNDWTSQTHAAKETISVEEWKVPGIQSIYIWPRMALWLGNVASEPAGRFLHQTATLILYRQRGLLPCYRGDQARFDSLWYGQSSGTSRSSDNWRIVKFGIAGRPFWTMLLGELTENTPPTTIYSKTKICLRWLRRQWITPYYPKNPISA